MNNAIICDVDGTLALKVKRGPFEHEKSGSDTLCQEVKNLLDLYKSNGYKIIILSGRQERFAEITKTWLATNNVQYDLIYLRENFRMILEI